MLLSILSPSVTLCQVLDDPSEDHLYMGMLWLDSLYFKLDKSFPKTAFEKPVQPLTNIHFFCVFVSVWVGEKRVSTAYPVEEMVKLQ